MANRRDLKKLINATMLEIIDDAYSVLTDRPGEKDKEAKAIIDEAVEALDDLLARISNYKQAGSNGEIGKHFAAIKADFDKKSEDLFKKLDKLG